MFNRLLLVLALVTLSGASASGQESPEDQYAHFYGDGIRAYAESRYDDALDNLYRAFAVQQTPLALKLIVRAHDFSGDCSARETAAQMLRDLFPAERVPRAQTCRVTGQLTVVCAPRTERARINGTFWARCGATVTVPVGTHRVEDPQVSAVTVEVTQDDRAVARLIPRPHKWYLDDQRVGTNRFQVHSELGRDPDMPPTFEIRKWQPRPTAQ